MTVLLRNDANKSDNRINGAAPGENSSDAALL